MVIFFNYDEIITIVIGISYYGNKIIAIMNSLWSYHFITITVKYDDNLNGNIYCQKKWRNYLSWSYIAIWNELSPYIITFTVLKSHKEK